MEQEGEEEEAAADHRKGPAVCSPLRYWNMLDCEIGGSRKSILYAVVVGDYIVPFGVFCGP